MHRSDQTAASPDPDSGLVIHDHRLNVCFRDHACVTLMADCRLKADWLLLEGFVRKSGISKGGITSRLEVR